MNGSFLQRCQPGISRRIDDEMCFYLWVQTKFTLIGSQVNSQQNPTTAPLANIPGKSGNEERLVRAVAYDYHGSQPVNDAA